MEQCDAHPQLSGTPGPFAGTEQRGVSLTQDPINFESTAESAVIERLRHGEGAAIGSHQRPEFEDAKGPCRDSGVLYREEPSIAATAADHLLGEAADARRLSSHRRRRREHGLHAGRAGAPGPDRPEVEDLPQGERGLAFGAPDFITVCHSDDLLLPESLESRARLATQSGASLVYSDMVVMRDDIGVHHCKRARDHATAGDLYESLLRHEGAGVPYKTLLWEAGFFRREVQGFDEKITSSEDWDIALRSARALVDTGGTHAMTDRVTVAKRVHVNCLQNQNLRDGTKERCYEMILRKHLQGAEYQAAIDRERNTNFRRPAFLRRWVTKVVARSWLRGVEQMLYRFHCARAGWPKSGTQHTDPRAAEFVGQVGAADVDSM